MDSYQNLLRNYSFAVNRLYYCMNRKKSALKSQSRFFVIII